MCCLFGMVDYGNYFGFRQKTKLLRCLAKASEARGKDASGIAYCTRCKLQVYKRALPGHKLRIHVPEQSKAVMGHTRLTTQGNERRNQNNHPFLGKAGSTTFALAHNGMIYNDKILRRKYCLPKTGIETDSYVAVQLLEQSGEISFSSLGKMAEEIEGSFSFTVLDEQENLYFVKGDNPLCIYHYPKIGVYLYASTESVLLDALSRIPVPLGKPNQVVLDWGDILQIDSKGNQFRGEFDPQNLRIYPYSPCSVMLDPPAMGWHFPKRTATEHEYIRILKSIASFYGYTPGLVDSMLDGGFSTDEIEEMIYCGRV